jgi:NitT/TauT family transport system permease protein
VSGEAQTAAAVRPYHWGRATAFLQRVERLRLVDLAILASLAGALFGLVALGREWTATTHPAAVIDLSPWALPKYTMFSLARGLAAYVLSLVFSILYGYWAAKDRVAGRVLIPLLDVLQSIPVLGFMPGVVLALLALFPRSNVGLELAAILMIFTGQAWNMAFSFYHSLRSIPVDLQEASQMYRFSAWDRLRRLELPASAIGLVWNSMMSMAGGWFFLMISETFVLGDKDLRLPGLGSYMAEATAKGDGSAMAWAILAMTALIVALDQLLWRPVVVWAQKFRVDDSGQAEAMHSWFLELLRGSALVGAVSRRLRRPGHALAHPVAAPRSPGAWGSRLSAGLFLALLAVMLLGTVKLVALLVPVTGREWLQAVGAGGVTLGRVLLATALGTLWTLPAGLAIGLHPKLSRLLQPVVQVVASFPAPMLFPAAIAAMHFMGIRLGWGSVVLMLLGTQWYVLFNVVAGATAIPADLREATVVLRMGRWRRFTSAWVPAVFPYLVTGWVTAAGGAWNASIVSEYVSFKGNTLTTIGLGATVSQAAAAARFPLLAASLLVMSAIVVTFNRLVWRRLNELAERKYALTR